MLGPISPGNFSLPGSPAHDLYQKSLTQGDVEAARMLRRAAELDPNSHEIRFRLAFLYHKMNFREEAIREYEATLKLRSCHKKALVNLGNLRTDARDLDEAASLYNRAIKCAPDFYAGYYNLALLQRDQRRSLLEKSLTLKPDHFGSMYLLARTYYQEDTGKGLSMMEKACNLKKEHAGCLRELGELYIESRIPDVARKHLKRALFLSNHPVERREIRLILQKLDSKEQGK
ncbi:MAG: hypothetical protein CMF59_11145 [Leptospiraceae bacterium]|nr:hypothetical protein [Leptospiraceae bacterium]